MAVAPPHFDARTEWFINRIMWAWWVSGRPSVTVTSWFRTAAVNRSVGGVARSWHLDGLAMDLVNGHAMVGPARSVGLEVIVEGSHTHFEVPWSRSV